MLFVILINGIAQMIEIKSKESEEWGHVIFWKKEKVFQNTETHWLNMHPEMHFI